MRDLIAVLTFTLWSLTATAQGKVSVGFWNVENLYDTIPSLFYDDGDYTPDGRLGWDKMRYGAKLTNLARVIGDMGLDVAALAEVENETALRDLVMALADDYNYIHRTSGDRRGIDLAMIYKGDKFFPEQVQLIRSHSTREFLHVSGQLAGERINLLVCHMPSKPNSRDYRQGALRRLAVVADSIRQHDPQAGLVVMGDFNCDPAERIFRQTFGKPAGNIYPNTMLYGAVEGPSGGGVGSYAWNGKWMLFDNILLSMPLIYGDGLTYERGGVFVRDYMLDGTESGTTARRKGYPLRTFTSGRYTAGYSDHLPVYVILSK